MDPAFKATLDLIEAVSANHPIDQRGRQLILVVKDFVEDGDLESAREILRRIGPEYFSEHVYRQAAEERMVAEAIAKVVDVFGLEFATLARPGGES